jgi:hypothetical protein
VDGKHTVSVQSDDPAAVTEGLVWAQETYKKLQRLSPSGATASSAALPERNELTREDAETGAPICANHQVPMVWVDRNGGFYSCHEKTANGSWCTYRPPKRAAAPLPF